MLQRTVLQWCIGICSSIGNTLQYAAATHSVLSDEVPQNHVPKNTDIQRTCHREVAV
jgi:hypothetical protein